jgi:hypothetical protein
LRSWTKYKPLCRHGGICNADGEGFVDYTYEKPAADKTSRQQDIVS